MAHGAVGAGGDLQQFSAAVADPAGRSASLVEVTRATLPRKVTYLLICLSAIVPCWATTTVTILALASLALAFNYLVQCLVAITDLNRSAQKMWFGALAFVLPLVTVFATPIG